MGGNTQSVSITVKMWLSEFYCLTVFDVTYDYDNELMAFTIKVLLKGRS